MLQRVDRPGVVVVVSTDAVEAADEARRLRDQGGVRVGVFVVDPTAPDDLSGAEELAEELLRGIR